MKKISNFLFWMVLTIAIFITLETVIWHNTYYALYTNDIKINVSDEKLFTDFRCTDGGWDITIVKNRKKYRCGRGFFPVNIIVENTK